MGEAKRNAPELAGKGAFDAAMNYPQSLAHGTEVVDC